MVHTLVVMMHVGGAIGALISGFLALRFPNGTRRHRFMGKIYLVMWVMLFIGGIIIGLGRPGISPFEVINWVSMAFVVRAYVAVLMRKRIGKTWLRTHYNAMLVSFASVVVATLNQLLQRTGVSYPLWVSIVLFASPSFVLPWYVRVLDRRYGFAKVPAAPSLPVPVTE